MGIKVFLARFHEPCQLVLEGRVSGQQGSKSMHVDPERFGGLDGGEIVLICFIIFHADRFLYLVHVEGSPGELESSVESSVGIVID